MVHVTTPSDHIRQITGGVDTFDLNVATLREMIRELDKQYPGLGEYIQSRVSFAVDGEIHQDALALSLRGVEEVVLIPKISGG